MKILRKDMKEQEIKLQVESLEDLWHLKHVIEKNDLVTAKTFRKTSVKSGGEYSYGDKRPMVLTIKVEKSEWKSEEGVLRVTGQIVEGPEDVPKQAYHSLNIELNSVISIKKEKWKMHHLERLERAKIKRNEILVCLLDREEADFAVLRESGIEMKAKIENYDKEDMEKFYEKIIAYIKELKKGDGYETIVFAGPGFERENILKYANEKKEKLGNVILEHTSSIGVNGVHELLKKASHRLIKESRIAKESEYVNEILKRIRSDGLVVYGKGETEKAVEMGAVETLFISQEKVDEYESLMEMEEKMGGKVVIIGDDHELGEQFLHLGGIAGFLRFKVGIEN